MNQATQFRRDLHQIPETSFTEFKTKEYVVSVLKTLHCEVIELLETGAAAYFDAGRPATLAYRADMDALPIQEETGLDFASRHPGKMHACGHDGHMAMLLGLAQELDQLDRSGWKNNILLIFQPSGPSRSAIPEFLKSTTSRRSSARICGRLFLPVPLPAGRTR